MGEDEWWDHMDGVMGRGHMGGSGWWPLWWLVVVLLVAGVAAFVVWMTRRSGAPPDRAPLPGQAPPAGSGGDAAEAVLRERFARGEVDESEFDARLARLRASR
jgi:putative membrane protein